MTTTFVAEVNIGATIPGALGLLLSAQASLQAQLDAMLAFQAQVTLTIPNPLAELIALAEQILHSLEQMLALQLEPPTISVQVEIIASAVATLSAQLSLYLALFGLFAHAGVFIYTFDGPTNSAGGELTTALSAGFPGHGATDHANILMLGCVDGATWTAMQAVFKTS